MKAVIQRVSSAKVEVAGKVVGQINEGLLVLLGVEAGDNQKSLKKLADKVMKYRCFSDDADKMNLNVQQVGGQLLVVSQFTIAADTNSGLRPSFSSAAQPDLAKAYYEEFVAYCAASLPVQTGQFGADMQVSLTNNGPVTFILSS